MYLDNSKKIITSVHPTILLHAFRIQGLISSMKHERGRISY